MFIKEKSNIRCLVSHLFRSQNGVGICEMCPKAHELKIEKVQRKKLKMKI